MTMPVSFNTLTPFCRDKTQSLGALGMARSSALGCGLMDAIGHTLTPFCRDKTQPLGALGMSRSSALGCGLMDAIDHTYTLLS